MLQINVVLSKYMVMLYERSVFILVLHPRFMKIILLADPNQKLV
jgi:hypothetical protein